MGSWLSWKERSHPCVGKQEQKCVSEGWVQAHNFLGGLFFCFPAEFEELCDTALTYNKAAGL